MEVDPQVHRRKALPGKEEKEDAYNSNLPGSASPSNCCFNGPSRPGTSDQGLDLMKQARVKGWLSRYNELKTWTSHKGPALALFLENHT